MKLFAELQRRNVFRMVGLYLVGAWLVVQVAATLLPVFAAPAWMMRFVVVVLAIGFVAALVFSWVFELTPQGIRREIDADSDGVANPGPERRIPQTSDAPGAAPVARADIVVRRRRLDLVIIALLLVALGYFVLERTGLAPWMREEASQSVAQKSIAVLAFADLSAGKDSEYFADGIAEEILNALARVDDLKVAGRTSSFYFKGRNEDMRTIGSRLGVAHLLEGSVRKQGDRVRITAQLIEVASGYNLWSESYDGRIDDVFELQEQIARAITDELSVVLAADQRQRLVPKLTDLPEAYALYLQASAIFNRRDGNRFLDGIEQLTRVVKLDPAFARAHARLASMYAIAAEYTNIDLDRALAGAREHAGIAIGLDPSLAEPHAALARVHGAQRRWVDQQAAFEKALALDPNDVTANFWFGSTLFTAGYVTRGNAAMDRALARDPMLPIALLWRGMSYSEAGDQTRAAELLQRADDVGLALVGTGWSEVAEARGDIAEATRQLAAGSTVLFGAFPDGTADEFARASYGDRGARERVLAQVDTVLAADTDVVDGIVPYVLARLGEPARAMQVAQSRRLSHPMYLAMLWGPYGAATRRLPEFADFARAVGFAELWDQYGAPDLCKQDTNDDYRCE